MFDEPVAAENRGTGISGTPTGYRELDRLIAGLHAGDFYVVAARPGMGKTALALNLARTDPLPPTDGHSG
jgi:replicative DNA helicase